MKIGIDLRALQTGHKYRGIGEVTKQTTNRIITLAQADKNHDISFIFYEYDDDDPKKLLDIPKSLPYEVVKLGVMPENNNLAIKRDKLRRHLSDLYGNPIKNSSKSDVFLQFDYAFGVPKNTKTLLIKHDIIPYLFWDNYFESAWVHFTHKAARTTLRTLFTNRKFLRTLRRSLKNANVILAVSDSTKKDIQRHFHVPERKTKVAHLGVDIKPAKTNDHTLRSDLPTKPYLLFIGAGDARRRVGDAIAAYNNLKAQGVDIQFALVGENFKSPELIPNPAVRKAVLSSSYAKDILTLGYVDDATKQDLYKHAIAFIYPTLYEGFGIPVLESMLLGCPIVTYKNSSIPEVGGKYAYYARNWDELKQRIEEIMALSTTESNRRKKEARKYAEQFTWDRTAEFIYDELISLK